MRVITYGTVITMSFVIILCSISGNNEPKTFAVTSVGADATPPKPKPPPLTPKPAPSEIVKRLSFKRDTAPDPSPKRDTAPDISFKRVGTPEATFKREPAPVTEEKRDLGSNPVVNNNDKKKSMEEQVSVKKDSKVGEFLDEPPDKPPPEPPNTNQPNESTKVLKQYTLHNLLYQSSTSCSPTLKDLCQHASKSYFQIYTARPSFRLEPVSQGSALEHASPPPSLFESLPSVEYTRLEQEFDKLAGAGEEVVEEAEDDDVPFMDEESCSEPIAETPKRPSQLDIPSRGGAPSRRQGSVLESNNTAEEVQSPETPSYSSRPLPLSPSGPLLAHISISSPESSEAPELTPTNSPDPAPSIPPSVPSPAETAKPRLASPSSSPTLPSKNASSLVKSSASRSRQQAPPAESKPAQPPPPLPSQPVPALPARPVPNFVMQPPSSVPNLKLDSSSEDVEDEFQDELHFDPTISSGHLTGGGFRSTPVTVGVCPTPQPLTPAPTPRPEVPDKPVDEMTPTEAENLLADRLMERRSRAGSVLSDEQAEEVSVSHYQKH